MGFRSFCGFFADQNLDGMKAYKGVIFDMDGTLIDSESHNLQAAIELFRRKGVQVAPKDFGPFIGGGADKYISGVAEKFNVDIEDRAAAKAELYAIYDELIKGAIQPVKGAIQLVEDCKKAGMKVAVGTSADWTKLNSNLRELGLEADDFDAIVQGLEVTHKKPAPDTFLKAAEKLGLQPEECLVFEDAPNGVKAAKAGGFDCIAVMTTFGMRELLEADFCINDLSEAITLVGVE